MALAGLAWWLARAAHAEDGVDAVEGAPAKPAPATPAAPAAAAAPVRKTAFSGYAAESARTLARLPPEEREARGFLRAASQNVRFEVEAARLARARAQGTQALAWADDLLQHHEAADVDLLRLMHLRGMAPPMLENGQRKALNRLARLSGARFDREFMELTGPAQQREQLQFYEKAAASVADPAVRAWIDRQLAALRQQAAERAASRLSARGGLQRVE